MRPSAVAAVATSISLLAAGAAGLLAFTPGGAARAANVHVHGRFVLKALEQRKVREAFEGAYRYQPACWGRFYPQPERAAWPELTPEDYPDIHRFRDALLAGANFESHQVYVDARRAAGPRIGVWMTDPKDHRGDYLDKYVRYDARAAPEGGVVRGWSGLALAYYVAGKRLHCEQDLEVPAHQKMIYHTGEIGWTGNSWFPSALTYSDGLEATSAWFRAWFFDYPDDWRDDPDVLYADGISSHQYSWIPPKSLRTKYWLSDREDDDDPPGTPNEPDDPRYRVELDRSDFLNAAARWKVRGAGGAWDDDLGVQATAIWAREGPQGAPDDAAVDGPVDTADGGIAVAVRDADGRIVLSRSQPIRGVWGSYGGGNPDADHVVPGMNYAKEKRKEPDPTGDWFGDFFWNHYRFHGTLVLGSADAENDLIRRILLRGVNRTIKALIEISEELPPLIELLPPEPEAGAVLLPRLDKETGLGHRLAATSAPGAPPRTRLTRRYLLERTAGSGAKSLSLLVHENRRRELKRFVVSYAGKTLKEKSPWALDAGADPAGPAFTGAEAVFLDDLDLTADPPELTITAEDADGNVAETIVRLRRTEVVLNGVTCDPARVPWDRRQVRVRASFRVEGLPEGKTIRLTHGIAIPGLAAEPDETTREYGNGAAHAIERTFALPESAAGKTWDAVATIRLPNGRELKGLARITVERKPDPPKPPPPPPPSAPSAPPAASAPPKPEVSWVQDHVSWSGEAGAMFGFGEPTKIESSTLPKFGYSDGRAPAGQSSFAVGLTGIGGDWAGDRGPAAGAATLTVSGVPMQARAGQKFDASVTFAGGGGWHAEVGQFRGQYPAKLVFGKESAEGSGSLQGGSSWTAPAEGKEWIVGPFGGKIEVGNMQCWTSVKYHFTAVEAGKPPPAAGPATPFPEKPPDEMTGKAEERETAWRDKDKPKEPKPEPEKTPETAKPPRKPPPAVPEGKPPRRPDEVVVKPPAPPRPAAPTKPAAPSVPSAPPAAGGLASSTADVILGSPRPWESPQVQALMDEWLRVSKPMEEVGRSWRWNEWAQITDDRAVRIVGPPDHPGQTRHEYLWGFGARAKSVRHGTMREYIERRLRGQSGVTEPVASLIRKPPTAPAPPKPAAPPKPPAVPVPPAAPAPPKPAAPSAPPRVPAPVLNGAWTIIGGDPPKESGTMTLRQEGGRVTGSLRMTDGEAGTLSGAFDAAARKFTGTTVTRDPGSPADSHGAFEVVVRTDGNVAEGSLWIVRDPQGQAYRRGQDLGGFTNEFRLVLRRTEQADRKK